MSGFDEAESNIIPIRPGHKGDTSGKGGHNGGNNSGGGGNDMEIRIARLESDVGNIRESVAEIKQDAKDFRAEVRESFSLLRGEMREDVNVLRGESNALRGEMQSGFATIHADIKTQTWAFIGIIAAIISAGIAGGFYLNQESVKNHNDIVEIKQTIKSMAASIEEIKKAVTK